MVIIVALMFKKLANYTEPYLTMAAILFFNKISSKSFLVMFLYLE